MNIKNLIEETGLVPKKKASTHGGEYSSSCPFCKEGDDRFLIWPERSNGNGEYKGGRYSCRVCGQYGDAINFFMKLKGMSYQEACKKLSLEMKEMRGAAVQKPKPQPLIALDPTEKWLVRATAFIDWSHVQLMRNPQALELVMSRGFTIESIKRFKLGFNPQNFFRIREDWGLSREVKDDGSARKHWLPSGIVIPTFSMCGRVVKIKIRRSDWKEGDKLPKYVEVSGSKRCPSLFGNLKTDIAFILESELDGLLVQQEAGDLCYVVALGGSTKPLDLQTDQILSKTHLVLFCPDFDEAGAVAWRHWKKMFPDIKRILTPEKKAPGDAFLAGIDLREWIKEVIESLKIEHEETE